MRVFQILAVLFAFLLNFPVQAQEPERYVQVRLIPERGTVRPGESLWIGIEQSIHPGWHTYWKNPGDSGAAPEVAWTLPEGFEIGPVQYPAPHKIPYGPLVNYGYDNQAVFLQKLTAPKDWDGGPVTLAAEAQILVCQDICIPETSILSLTLSGGGDGAAAGGSAYLAAAKTKIPVKTDWTVWYGETYGNFILKLPLTAEYGFSTAVPERVEFFPEDWGLIDNAAPAQWRIEGDHVILEQKRGDRELDGIETTDGVLTFTGMNGVRQALSVTANPIAAASAPQEATVPGEVLADFGQITLAQALVFALLGGLILNLMPCVFPVLSLKALSLVKIADKHPERARLHGIAYTAGVVLSFLLIAGLLIALKAGGSQIGWGFQLQNPAVVGVLAYLLFIIGLNLAGFFEIRNAFGTLGDRLTRGDGLFASFFTGALATLVATPCTAPFMAGALGFALTQPASVNLAVFAALGFGLALPYLALSFAPALQKALPRPGRWMETFRHVLAVPMFASSAWLVWVVSHQAGTAGVLGLGIGMGLITFGLWRMKKRGRIGVLAPLAIVLSLGFLPAGGMAPSPMEPGFGEAWSQEKLEEALAGDAPVFVEMTADWCITCKLNHAVALNTEATRTVFEERGVRYLTGDWTNYDGAVTTYLNSFGRNGVPLYVYYGPPGETGGKRPTPKILPQLLTPGIVRGIVTDQKEEPR